MSQLKRLPVDCLKIDQTFVVGLGVDRGDRAIVDATVNLARSFGLDVVAEGVETVEVVHELLGLGCHRAQGYLLSRPKPASELEPLLLHGGIDPAAFTRLLPSVPVSPLGERAPLSLRAEGLRQPPRKSEQFVQDPSMGAITRHPTPRTSHPTPRTS
jgi:hypothetical protein